MLPREFVLAQKKGVLGIIQTDATLCQVMTGLRKDLMFLTSFRGLFLGYFWY